MALLYIQYIGIFHLKPILKDHSLSFSRLLFFEHQIQYYKKRISMRIDHDSNCTKSVHNSKLKGGELWKTQRKKIILMIFRQYCR